MTNTKDDSTGLGVVGVTFLVFVILKLTDNLDWSWWWITAPIWGSLALQIVAGAVIGVAEAWEEHRGRLARRSRKGPPR